MGLDTSHDCWHGPYSSFMIWRQQLHYCLTGQEPTPENLERAWADGMYSNQKIPIDVLMNHSDCDGEIPAKVCGPLADALEELRPKMEAMSADVPWFAKKTATFIKGLRLAAIHNESVVFA